MVLLGIDTSCDDTSAAVVRDGCDILSNIVSSQVDIHRKYGGIVPELASRKHIEMIWPIVDESLIVAGIKLAHINAIAVCHGPGLIGSLLVGCGFAKAISYSRNIPLIAVNHLEGHIFSTFLENEKPAFPFLSLVVSGGHTSIYIIERFGKYKELGRTRDDAAGEAYDKVSKLLGLGYPGGPIIDKLANEGDDKAFHFPRAYVPDSLDFSFSGLKTAVRNKIHGRREDSHTADDGAPINDEFIRNIAASFQSAVVDVLVRKIEWAIVKTGIHRVTVSGGVAANSALRAKLTEMARTREIELFLPSRYLCTDNAAMIAAAGYYHLMAGELTDMDLNPKAYLPLGV